MSFKTAAIAAAKSVLKSAELAEMTNQKNVFAFDIKGRLSADKNKKILDGLAEVQYTLPNLQ